MSLLECLRQKYWEAISSGGENHSVKSDLVRVGVHHLSSAEQDIRFHFRQFTNVIAQSAETLDEFCPRNAGSAFRLLEIICTNLLLYPWRQEREYRRVKKASPFYKLHLERSISNVDQLMNLIGYKECRTDGSTDLVLQDPPPSEETLLQIALDCFLAQIECHLVSQMRKMDGNTEHSWTEIVQQRCCGKISDTSGRCSNLLNGRSANLVEFNLNETDIEVDSIDSKRSDACPQLWNPPNHHNSTYDQLLRNCSSLEYIEQSMITTRADVHGRAPNCPLPWLMPMSHAVTDSRLADLGSSNWPGSNNLQLGQLSDFSGENESDLSPISQHPYSETNLQIVKDFAQCALQSSNESTTKHNESKNPNIATKPAAKYYGPYDHDTIDILGSAFVDSSVQHHGDTTSAHHSNGTAFKAAWKSIHAEINGFTAKIDEVRSRTAKTIAGDQECPRCHMTNRKNVLLCSYCDFYFVL